MRTAVLALVAVPAVAFTLIYARELLRHVRPTREGWHMLAFTGTIAVIALDGLVRHVWAGGPPRPPIYAAYAIAAICLWDRLWLLLHRQVIPRAMRRREADRVAHDLHD